jgi:hypothetical protein
LKHIHELERIVKTTKLEQYGVPMIVHKAANNEGLVVSRLNCIEAQLKRFGVFLFCISCISFLVNTLTQMQGAKSEHQVPRDCNQLDPRNQS